MQNLKLTLSSVKDITIEQEITKDLLKPFKNYINGVLKEKYEDNIIISSYEYVRDAGRARIRAMQNERGVILLSGQTSDSVGVFSALAVSGSPDLPPASLHELSLSG